MRVIPVKLRREDFQMPDWFTDDQYLRLWLWEYSEPGAVVDWVCTTIDSDQRKPGAPNPQS